MLRHVVQSPARDAGASMISIVTWITMLGVSIRLPNWIFPYPFLFSFWLSVAPLILVGVMPLVLLWRRGYTQMQRGVVMLNIGILVLYAVLILWPAYDSGLAWFVGDPKGGWQQHYAVWYVRQGAIKPSLLDYTVLMTLLGTMIAGWYLLLPFGVVTLLQLPWSWPNLTNTRRWITVAVAALAILVPLFTWRASHQFMRWIID